MRRVLLLGGFALTLFGCAHIDYVGETAAPTTNVQVFYTEANVPRAYHVMGEVVATANMFVSSRKVQEQMIEKARQKGADAVVILGMEHYQAGESTNYTENTTQSKDKKGRTRVTTSGSSSTSSEENKRIRGIFIKFKAESDAPDSAPNGGGH
jgi:hypothetical protein